MLNEQTYKRFQAALATCDKDRTIISSVAQAIVLDAGIQTAGSLSAGILLGELCLGGAAAILISPCDADRFAVDQSVVVQTDSPVTACLGAQYAGWPVQSDDFFAMGSGPMRLFRGKEPVLKELKLSESGNHVVGVLESDKLPSELAVRLIADECGVATSGICLATAPSSSIAGSVQVVARSIETALHKLHELKFDVTNIVSAIGSAPLPPPAKPGDTVTGIGRTNDAILYGARVTLWVDCDDEQIEAVANQVPSHSSADHGQPFAKIFKAYQYDFYQVDAMLFSPAVVTFHNLRSGRTFCSGKIMTDVLRESFLA